MSSQLNAEVVRAAIQAFADGDLDRVASLYAPAACITAVPDGWPEPAPIEGRDAVMRQFARLQEDWDEHSLEAQREAIEGDWVVVELRWTTRGARSGVPLVSTVIGAYRLEGARMAEARFYWDWDEALANVGIGN